MKQFDCEEIYNKAFPDDKSKAEAFDKLVKNYYYTNFGTMPKAEIDLLLFSKYIEGILDNPEIAEDAYSDFALSKLLGITRSRVASLKERQELKYPSDFAWKKSFVEVVKKAEPADDKVKLYIRDIRLYSKLCEIIEDLGSYTESTLTKQLLVVSIPVFVDLMVEATDGDDKKKEIKEQLKEILDKNDFDDSYFTEDWTLRELLKHRKDDIVCDLVSEIIKNKVPIVGETAAENVRFILNSFLKRKEKKGSVQK